MATPDTLEMGYRLALLGMTTCGVAALALTGRLSTGAILLAAIGLTTHFLSVTGFLRLRFKSAWISIATITCVGYYPLELLYFSDDWIAPTIRLICILAIIRNFAASTTRDHRIQKLTAFTAICVATLLADSFSFLVWLLPFTFISVVALALSEVRTFYKASPAVKILPFPVGWVAQLTRLSSMTIIATLILTATLFVFLPRTARTAIRSLASGYHLSGFSDEVTLGQIGQLKTATTPVMHIRIEEPNATMQLKWRGTALSQFDGVRWYNPRRQAQPIAIDNRPLMVASDELRRLPAPRISYRVRLANIQTDTLFFAGVPELVQVDGVTSVSRLDGDTYRIPITLSFRREYQAVSILPPDLTRPPFVLDIQDKLEHLLLPGSTDMRILALARELSDATNVLQAARNIEQHLQSQYRYTSDLLPKKVSDPLANFLFDRREGHCEYFASAMAVMLRAVNIPSRVVTGFQSGQYNPMTGWHIIRASDAHSWTEAWIDGRGWMTFDPTPPASAASASKSLWTQWLLYVDAADTLWRHWIVDYSLHQQVAIAARLEQRTRNLAQPPNLSRLRERLTGASHRSIPVATAIIAAAVLVAIAYLFRSRLWIIREHRKPRARAQGGHSIPQDASILYNQMLSVLGSKGICKPTWLTPGEFAAAVPKDGSPDLVRDLTHAYHRLRYGHETAAGCRMITLLRQLEEESRRR